MDRNVSISESVGRDFKEATTASVILNAEAKAAHRFDHGGLHDVALVKKVLSLDTEGDWGTTVDLDHLMASAAVRIGSAEQSEGAVLFTWFVVFIGGSAAAKSDRESHDEEKSGESCCLVRGLHIGKRVQNLGKGAFRNYGTTAKQDSEAPSSRAIFET